MKYLRYNEARETLIDKKMIFLEDITADMRDSGMDVKIFNGSDNSLIGTLRMHLAAGRSTGPTSKYIYVVVMKNGSKVVGSTEFEEFFERLKDSGVGYRFSAEGETYLAGTTVKHYVVIGIDKRSRLSREEIQNLIS
jgi:hypothetical protein